MSSNLVRHFNVDDVRALVRSEEVVTVNVAGCIVKARAQHTADGGAQLTLMADTPLGRLGAVIHAPKATFENMLEAAKIYDVLPRAAEALESSKIDFSVTIRPLLSR